MLKDKSGVDMMNDKVQGNAALNVISHFSSIFAFFHGPLKSSHSWLMGLRRIKNLKSKKITYSMSDLC